jgi:hypothetical protein
LGHPEATAECEKRKRYVPEASTKLLPVDGDAKRGDQRQAREERPAYRLPLSPDEQTAEPRRRDPWKHLELPSKARALLSPMKEGVFWGFGCGGRR